MMLSCPQDLLLLILPSKASIYEAQTGLKEKFRIKSRARMDVTLGWVRKSSWVSGRTDWSRNGAEKSYHLY